MLHICEPHLLQASSAATAVLQVHLPQRLDGDLLELGAAGTGLLGVEEAGGVAGRQRDGEVTDAVLVGGADGAV